MELHNTFKKFFDISSVFKFDAPTDTAKNTIYKKADAILNSGGADVFYEMIKNGYKPTATQAVKFDMIVYEFIDSQNTTALANLTKNGYEFTTMQYAQFCLNDNFKRHFLYSSHLDDDNEKQIKGRSSSLIKQIHALSKKPEYSRELTLQFFERINLLVPTHKKTDSTKDSPERDFINNTLALMRNYNEIDKFSMFENLTMDEYLAQIEKLRVHVPVKMIKKNIGIGDTYKTEDNMSYTIRNALSSLEKYMSNNLNRFCSTDLKNLMEQTQVAYLEDNLSQLAQKAVSSDMKNYNIDKLPNATKDIIHNIKEQYSKVMVNFAQLDAQQQHDVNHLVKEQMPKMLQKYFSMDNEYRVSMRDTNGNSADDLLNESMHTIENHLGNVLKQINERALQDLKVEHRYTKMKAF